MKSHPSKSIWQPGGVCLKGIKAFAFLCFPLFSYTQTFFAASNTPADNAAQAGPTVAVAPPASMVAGDLVIIYAHYRATGATLTVSNAGGQTWNLVNAASVSGSTQSYNIFWCQFNGTWAANPSITIGAGTNDLSVMMYVFRPSNANSKWGVNIGPNNTTGAAATAQSITGITTTAPKTVTMGFWSCAATNTWGTLTGTGWSKTGTGFPVQVRNTTTGQSHTAAYIINTLPATVPAVSQTQSAATIPVRSIVAWHELNDVCSAPTILTSGTTCTNTAGTLQNSTVSSPAVTTACATAGGDVWYQFTAQTAYPVITLSSMNTGTLSTPRIQLLSGSCGSFSSLGCVSGSSVSSLALSTDVTPGGAGLTVGQTYFIRIYSNTLAPTGTNWTFNICVQDRTPGYIDFGKSYINVSKRTVGGTINIGDTLEIRATFVARDLTWSGSTTGAADSLAFYDTLLNNSGFKLLAGSGTIVLKTNEGKDYKVFTNAANDDAGQATQIPATLDTAIRINFGTGASNTARGKLRNTSKPSVFGSSCIIMATYRVQVYAPYNTKINWGGGSISYRDTATGVYNTYNFKRDSLAVYNSLGLCPNAVSVTNAIGVETNGTFGAPVTAAPLIRNRAASTYVPGYIYSIFARNPSDVNNGIGPGDYYYGITNNTSAEFGIVNTRPKPDVDPDGGGVKNYYRLFQVWDIMGDHTGASNTAKGNPPCDTTKAMDPITNPCGYMLVVNSSYKTDTAFQYSVTGLCPNTYYEVSAWVKNICSRCSCDSNGVTPTNFSTGLPNPAYLPFGASDSSGVQPNLAFEINGTDYYTTGNIQHFGARAGITPQAADSMNRWVKRGFVYKTGLAENSFNLTIRNNAPGGGGNDWALDDISIATCLPNMSYSPTINPSVCDSNILLIRDTVRSYFNDYVNYQWQRSTDGGVTWNDIAGATGVGVPVWNGTAYEYVASYTIPATATYAVNNGDKYRLIVATTLANLGSVGCQVTDGVSIITLTVLDCPTALSTNLLSFNGHLSGNRANLSWTMSKEDEPLTFTIERSTDGINFVPAGSVPSYNNYVSEVNYYSFIDPVPVNGSAWYRIIVTNSANKKKTSRSILLKTGTDDFGLTSVVNPFKNELIFEIISNRPSHITAELMDLLGKPVKKVSYNIYPGTNSLSIPNTNILAPGIYTLRIVNKDMIINKQVMKAY
jgi:trimeric autotransporter adhesin